MCCKVRVGYWPQAFSALELPCCALTSSNSGTKGVYKAPGVTLRALPLLIQMFDSSKAKPKYALRSWMELLAHLPNSSRMTCHCHRL